MMPMAWCVTAARRGWHKASMYVQRPAVCRTLRHVGEGVGSLRHGDAFRLEWRVSRGSRQRVAAALRAGKRLFQARRLVMFVHILCRLSVRIDRWEASRVHLA